MFVFNSGMGGYKCDCCNRLIRGNPQLTATSKKGNKLHYCRELCMSLHFLKDKSDRRKNKMGVDNEIKS